MEEKTMTLGEAAQALGCSEKTVRRLAQDGKIDAFRFRTHGRWYVRKGSDGLPVRITDEETDDGGN